MDGRQGGGDDSSHHQGHAVSLTQYHSNRRHPRVDFPNSFPFLLAVRSSYSHSLSLSLFRGEFPTSRRFTARCSSHIPLEGCAPSLWKDPSVGREVARRASEMHSSSVDPLAGYNPTHEYASCKQAAAARVEVKRDEGRQGWGGESERQRRTCACFCSAGKGISHHRSGNRTSALFTCWVHFGLVCCTFTMGR